MLEAIEHLNLITLLKLYALLGTGVLFGIFLYRYFHTLSTSIFKNELLEYKHSSEEIINAYKADFSTLENEIKNTQDYTSNNFEKINLNMIELNKILNTFNTNLKKVKELEDEVVKYKKILKRKEKRDGIL